MLLCETKDGFCPMGYKGPQVCHRKPCPYLPVEIPKRSDFTTYEVVIDDKRVVTTIDLKNDYCISLSHIIQLTKQLVFRFCLGAEINFLDYNIERVKIEVVRREK